MFKMAIFQFCDSLIVNSEELQYVSFKKYNDGGCGIIMYYPRNKYTVNTDMSCDEMMKNFMNQVKSHS